MRILLVEDDAILVDFLRKSLTAQRYIVDTVADGERAWDYLTQIDYDLILLDVLLPKLDGVSLCRRLRAQQNDTPILMLTAQNHSHAKVRGLDAGADDYLVKPFEIEELMARIRALLRRQGSDASPILRCGSLVIDPADCSASYGGLPLALSSKEYGLLQLFLHHPQHVFSIEEILESLWSAEDYPAEATVRSHIRRLRQKLCDAGAPSDFVANLHGRGYFLKADLPTQQALSQGCMIDEQQLGPGNDAQSLQKQYQIFLEETWQQFQPQALDYWKALDQETQALLHPTGSSPDRESKEGASINLETAQLLAHRLAGTLGLFHQTAAMEAAQFLESCFGQWDAPQGQARPSPLQLQQALGTIRQALDCLDLSLSSHPDSQPLFWIVDQSPQLTQALQSAAQTLPVQLAIAPPTLDLGLPHPVAILLPLSSPIAAERTIATLQQRFDQALAPPLLIGLSECLTFEDRLRSVRLGLQYVLDQRLPPTTLLDTSLKLLQPQAQKIRALLVDDDPLWLQAITRQLEAFNFQVTALDNPHRLWLTLEQHQPDILILDIKMPQVNGLELCQTLRSDPRWQSLPIMFLSIVGDEKVHQDAFAAGADDVLCKPMPGKMLAQRILQRLSRHQSYLRQSA
ncbi:response regulator [Lyngbya confervoides]|uniref:Response regulator n=1 Tax=Lyngbya confervoides BDU141951 TaxID=1574623 RepID=A0ABD4T6W7_9CYAN|nr:response regulator [Lyngbya confervoides]MCM1984305.1 response regulator [Lyngbya confervoides BDU141951]